MGKKTNKTTLFIGSIIVFLIVTSVFGVIFYGGSPSSGPELNYGEYKFAKTGNKWFTEVNGNPMKFYYLPSETDKYNISDEAVETLKSTKMLYLTFDPNHRFIQHVDLMRFELTNDLAALNVFGVSGVNSVNSTYQLPYTNCMNATSAVPVIYFIEDEEKQIAFNNNCLTIQGYNGNELLGIKDKLLYSIIGIQNEQ